MRVSSPSAFTAVSAAMVCINVSAVPPDLEMATKRVVVCGSLPSSAPQVSGSRLSMKCRRGAARSAPTPGTAWPASCASVCPPRLEPPVPSKTTSVAFSARRRAVSRIGTRSSWVFGSHSNGREPSAWRARKTSSAPSARPSASFRAFSATPCGPMRCSRALSMDWTIAMDCCRSAGTGMRGYLPRVARATQWPKQRGRRLLGSAGGQPYRPTGHGDQHAAAIEALGYPPGVLDADGVDQTAAALDIVDAEIIDLDLRQLGGDLARGVERERIGALEERFRSRQLVGGRAVRGHALGLSFDDPKRVGGAVGARSGGADQHRGAPEPDQAVGDAIG